MKNTSNQITFKAIITGALILLMLIPATFVKSLIKERSDRQTEAIKSVSKSWAGEQSIVGPYLIIPTTITSNQNAKNTAYPSYKIVLPETLQVNGKLQPIEKNRGIYKVQLYESNLDLNGTFKLNKLKQYANETIHWSQAKLCYGISDIHGINNEVNIKMDNKFSYTLEAVLPENAITKKGLSVAINLNDYDKENAISFDSKLSLKGANSLSFAPIGNTTKVHLSSTYSSPSFIGSNLPKYDTANGFNATWSANQFGRSYPQIWSGQNYKLNNDSFGVKLFQPSAHYTKTERSIKYALLFIGLTFSFFFILELLQGKKVHLVQYLLVGIALIVFYTLLLSFGEYIGFDKAYLIASIATIGLITLYCKSLFVVWKNALMIGLFLSVLYVFIYFLIQMEQMNLLVGSVGLFILVAIAMYLSRKIDWYKPILINEK